MNNTEKDNTGEVYRSFKRRCCCLHDPSFALISVKQILAPSDPLLDVASTHGSVSVLKHSTEKTHALE